MAISGGTIVAVGHLGSADARRIIDARDKVVSPGFVDMHSHSDFNLIVDPRAESKVRQGVTTEVVGQCGISAAPMNSTGMSEARDRWPGVFDAEVEWSTMSQFLDLLASRGSAVNVAALVGHGNIRRLAMGEEDRCPTEVELAEMKRLLIEALNDGAFGMSTGLIYPPGVYSDLSELGELASVLGQLGGIYVTHLRNERDQLSDALGEALEVGRRGGCPVHISHLKAFEEENWGSISEALSAMVDARTRGVDVAGDQYPYTASATGLRSRLPAWVHDGGKSEMLRRLGDESIRSDILAEWGDSVDWSDIVIATVKMERNRDLEGLNISDIASQRDVHPGEFVMDLLLDEAGETNMIYHGISAEDVRSVMAHPLVMIGSDGAALSPEGVLGKGKPHPRSYGTFPRVLGKYVRDEGVMPLEWAIAKMTSWPASRLGILDRGYLAPGFRGDIVVFDPDAVEDRATYAKPHQFPRGIDFVINNGAVSVDSGESTGVLAGEILRSDLREGDACRDA